jgi:O-antigen ligase
MLLISIVVLSVLVGLMQLAQGVNSPLRFYAITNNAEAVGFFANRNHFAALLYSAMLFASVWLVDATFRVSSLPRRRVLQSHAVFVFGISLIAFVSLIMAQLMTRSRAGLGLSMLALVGSLAIGLTAHRETLSRIKSAKIVGASIAVTVMFSLQFALYRILERFGPDPLADARIPFARNTIEAAKAYMPFGSGLGTFVRVYQMFEKHSDVMVAYANHAHNDLLEVWLETGIVGPILIAVFVFWLARRSFAVWRAHGLAGASELDTGPTKAATIVLALLMLHSLVDYPLRTSAMMAVAALACGFLIAPQGVNAARDANEDDGPLRQRPEIVGARPQAPRNRDEDRPPRAQDFPRPREAWGEGVVDWPEAWRKPQTKQKDRP